ncbi:MAG: NYN domain-containing protein, partial [Lachnospiraceae bacterium]|nr:NYN domain-containing protein [Lachnospiraceae bacterium]
MNENRKRNLTVGILAHVDAGKTTLSEAILYLTGAIREAGRVDKGNAFLDTFALEKQRGITIFSKQARFSTENRDITLLDTPGHIDFSPEMERTLQVLDVAVLVISGSDGVTGQVKTIWRLLAHYAIPTFIFVNKMDQPGTDAELLLKELQRELSPGCIDLSEFESSDVQESVAVLDDGLLERYLEGASVELSHAQKLIADRKLFPLSFGSALKMTGVSEFLKELDRDAPYPDYGENFSGRVYKITRENGVRLSWLKILGGTLRIRDTVLEEKVDGIRLYSGNKYEAVQEVHGGQICAVAGLSKTRIGMVVGAGEEEGEDKALLQPIERCRILLPEGTDLTRAYESLRTLEEEEPLLNLSYSEESRSITAEIMGEVQTEILKQIAEERFGLELSFGSPETVYKETIRTEVEGVGHFEPLRHYAEVHLLMTPGEPGSGLVFENNCPRDYLTVNFQRLIMTHLMEKRHRGVLTGAEITDMKISLIAGRSHDKHTEGGDFRQATYRAVRQGLMMAESILLEPILDFHLDIPAEYVGRAMTDLERMSGHTEPPEILDGRAYLTGSLPSSELKDYPRQVAAYTGGNGHLSVSFRGYGPCHNAEEVILAKAYDADSDLRNPASSVFCSHGVGTLVPWDQVRSYMHIDTGWRPKTGADGQREVNSGSTSQPGNNVLYARQERDYAGSLQQEAYSDPNSQDGDAFYDASLSRRAADWKNHPDNRTFKERERDRRAFDRELKDIFERTYGPIKTYREEQEDFEGDLEPEEKNPSFERNQKYDSSRKVIPQKEYLLVDGYNMIFAWPKLKDLAYTDIKAARDLLMDILSNYAGYSEEHVILVYDAYKVSGGKERVYRHHNIDVIYTREAETADLYIEKAAHELTKKYRVTVATSDNIEQVIIFGAGAYRLSALNFLSRVEAVEKEIAEKL